MIAALFVSLAALAAPVSGPSGTPNPMSAGGPGGGSGRPGATVSQSSQEPEITAAEAALKAAELRAREAQIEVSRRISEVQEARMGVDLARAQVELRRLKANSRPSSGEKTLIKAAESKVSVLKSLVAEDLPAMRDLQARMLKAQTEDPASASGFQADLMARQRIIARKQLELELVTLRATGGDPARIQAMERRLEELRKQASGPGGGAPRTDAGRKGDRKKGKP